MLLFDIKDFNALVDDKSFFDQRTQKNTKRKKIFSKCQETLIIKLETFQITRIINIIINSLAQIYQGKENMTIPQQIIFTGKLEEHNSATIFFIVEKK